MRIRSFIEMGKGEALSVRKILADADALQGQRRRGRRRGAQRQHECHAAHAAEVHQHRQHQFRTDAQKGRDAQRQTDRAQRRYHFKHHRRQAVNMGVFLLEDADEDDAQHGKQQVQGDELRRVLHVFFVQPPAEALYRALAAQQRYDGEHERRQRVRLDTARRRAGRAADEHQHDG